MRGAITNASWSKPAPCSRSAASTRRSMSWPRVPASAPARSTGTSPAATPWCASSTTRAVADLHDLAPEILGAETGWRSVELYARAPGRRGSRNPPTFRRSCARMAELDPDLSPGREFADAIDGLVARAQAEGSLRDDVTGWTSACSSTCSDPWASTAARTCRTGAASSPIVLDGLRARPDLTPLPGTDRLRRVPRHVPREGARSAGRWPSVLVRAASAARTSTRFAHGSSKASVRPSSRVGDPVVRHPLAELAEVVGARHHDLDLAEPERELAPAGTAAVPRVHRHVVVVAAGRDEERRAAEARGRLEAEPVDVELARALDVADREVHVADDGIADAEPGAAASAPAR